MKLVRMLALLTAGMVMITACENNAVNKRKFNFGGQNGGESQKADPNTKDPESKGHRIDVNLIDSDANGFSLLATSAEAFTMTVKCDDFEASYQETPFFIIGNRTACSAHLDSLTTGGIKFTPSQDFESAEPGSKAIFSAGNGNKLFVTLTTAFPSEVTGPATVAYTFTQTTRGNDQEISVNQIDVAIEGTNAPNYEFLETQIPVRNGRLLFRFRCLDRMEGLTLERAKCSGQLLKEMSLAVEPLIQDQSIDSSSRLNVDREFLQQMFAKGGVSALAANLEYVPAGANGNGGFDLYIDIAPQQTNLPLGLAEAYILALSPDGADSFKYFKQTFFLNRN